MATPTASAVEEGCAAVAQGAATSDAEGHGGQGMRGGEMRVGLRQPHWLYCVPPTKNIRAFSSYSAGSLWSCSPETCTSFSLSDAVILEDK